MKAGSAVSTVLCFLLFLPGICRAGAQVQNIWIEPAFLCPGQTVTVHYQAKHSLNATVNVLAAFSLSSTFNYNTAYGFIYDTNFGNTPTPVPILNPMFSYTGYAGGPNNPGVTTYLPYYVVTTVPASFTPGSTVYIIIQVSDGYKSAAQAGDSPGGVLAVPFEVSCTKGKVTNTGNFWYAQSSVDLIIQQCPGTFTYTPTFSNTRTASPSLTATPTNTPSATPSATPSFSSTPSDTATRTSTSTYTQTLTATPSNTPNPSFSDTPTLTPSSTFTDTKTASPSSTVSFSPTQSVTLSNTPTTTPTATQTQTRTATPSFSNTATPSATPTQTFSFSATDTFSATPSQTPTVTATPTFTISPQYTATDTSTYTATPSASPSFSSTDTPSASPSCTATLTTTPTATPSSSASFTFTLTATSTSTPTQSSTPTITPSFTLTDTPTASPSFSATYTITQTLVPVPYFVTVSVYNSAGEKVRSLFSGSAQHLPQNLSLSNGSLAPGTSVQLLFNGKLSTGGNSLSWDGSNDAGQTVQNGTYYFRVEVKDSFGHLSETILPVAVLGDSGNARLALYNSAGEAVAFIALTSTSMPIVNFQLGSSSFANFNGSQLSITLLDSAGNSHTVAWDGRNSLGQPIQSGTYTFALENPGSLGLSQALTIVNAGSQADLSKVVAFPNPASGNKLQISYPLQAGWQGSVGLYTLTGEKVAQAADRSNQGLVIVPIAGLASGIYVSVFEYQSQAGTIGHKFMPVAVLH